MAVEYCALPLRAGYNLGSQGRDYPARNQESAMSEASPSTAPSVKPPESRLDSWKEIAAHLNRDVTTVQRWERRGGGPVQRPPHGKKGSGAPFRAELDARARRRALLTKARGGRQDPAAGLRAPA